MFTTHMDSCDTRFHRAFSHELAFSMKLRWFEPAKVISLKTQQYAENAR